MISLDTSSNENYDESLDEQSTSKLLPKQFVSKTLISNTNEYSIHKRKSSDEIVLNLLNTTTSSTESNNNDHCYNSNDESKLLFFAKCFSGKDNVIEPSKIIMGEETRTTVLIKNIPENYLPKELLNEFLANKDLKGKFNFFYLPYRENKAKNYTFAIVNFVNPLHVILFYELYEKKKFSKYITDKSLELCFITLNSCKNKCKHKDNTDILLPLKYLSLFKKMYKNAVCIIKEVNMYKDGLFKVKSFGKNVTKL